MAKTKVPDGILYEEHPYWWAARCAHCDTVVTRHDWTLSDAWDALKTHVQTIHPRLRPVEDTR